MGYDIVWHGRGGQGVVVAAHILAQSAYREGYKGITSAPQFGPERRGAPLTASTRIASETIRSVSQVQRADIAVVLDPSLLNIVNIIGTLKADGLLVINTHLSLADFTDYATCQLAVCNANHISSSCGLIRDGRAVANSPMLGALAKASGIVSLASLQKVIEERFKGAAININLMAIKEAYEKTDVRKC